MQWNFMFIINSLLLGAGLAMDAFTVSLANGLGEPDMKKRKMFGVAGMFGIFQGVMPLIGWYCVHTFINYFSQFEKFIPWISLFLLSFIGGKMLLEAKRGGEEENPAIGFAGLFVQGIATSIDALSVGFTIADYGFVMALVCSIIIAVVTFAICETGLYLGKTLGTKLAGKADVLGGVILIGIGIEIFVKGVFF